MSFNETYEKFAKRDHQQINEYRVNQNFPVKFSDMLQNILLKYKLPPATLVGKNMYVGLSVQPGGRLYVKMEGDIVLRKVLLEIYPNITEDVLNNIELDIQNTINPRKTPNFQ